MDTQTQTYLYCLTYIWDSGKNFTSPYLSDFDKDGSMDVLFYNQGTGNMWILFNKIPSKPILYDGNLCYNPVVREEITE